MTDLPAWAIPVRDAMARAMCGRDIEWRDCSSACMAAGKCASPEVMPLYKEDATAALAAALPTIAEHLKDPNAVHVNMLRGDIAKPSIAQIVHIYGIKELSEYLAATYGPATAIRREVTPRKP